MNPVVTVRGRRLSSMGFVVARGRIVEIDSIVDAKRVGRLAAAVVRLAGSDGGRGWRQLDP